MGSMKFAKIRYLTKVDEDPCSSQLSSQSHFLLWVVLQQLLEIVGS
jgi:hypothetical protein